MDNNKIKRLIFALCCIILALIGICTILAVKSARMSKKYIKTEITVEVRDTIRITDTIIQKKTEFVEVLRTDTIWKLLTDTDSIFVEVPIEKYSYKDTIKTDTSRVEIDIEFEGYKAKIDSLSLMVQFRPTISTFVPEDKKYKFGQSLTVGLQVGYGLGIQSRQFEPYIGVGVVYGFGITWKK